MEKFEGDNYFKSILEGLGLLDENGDFAIEHFTQSNEIWLKYLAEIRYLCPKNNLKYAKLGDYFIHDRDLYIITNDVKYRKFDVKEQFVQSKYSFLFDEEKYVLKALFAGFNTLKKDSNGKEIFYGDIVRVDLMGFRKCRDCVFYGNVFKGSSNQIDSVVYGAVSIFRGWHHCNNPDEPFYIADQAFGVIPNLCMSVETKVIANVYYNVSKKGSGSYHWRSVVWKACRSDYGDFSCEFWDDFVPTKKRLNKTTNQIWDDAISNYADYTRKRDKLKKLFGTKLGTWISCLKFNM